MPTVDTPKGRKLAEHGLLTVNGGEADDFDTADGVTYRHLRTGGEHQWSWSEGSEPERRMLALFGARTLMTNEASQVKQRHGSEVDPTAAIAERFKLLASGQWVDRTREGFQVNLDALAASLHDELVVQGQTPDYQKIRDKMESDKEWVRKVKSNPGVNARYIEKVGRPQASLDELAAALT
jgi:hypothetical protein